jgi:CBS-domain-containing membrane protein
MGGELIRDLGYGYVFYPVLLNVMVMVLVAVCVNYPFKWRRYPSVFAQKINQANDSGADIAQELHSRIIFAMRSMDSFVDVSEEDLVYLANTVINKMPGQNQTIGKAFK